MPEQLTLVTKTAVHAFGATQDGADVRLDPTFLAALGYELKPEGLCKDDVCTPVPADAALVDGSGISLQAFARLTGRPLALDLGESAAAIGEAAGSRAAMLDAARAPDFTLPDLDGRLHSLSDHRGKKVLLAAWASW